MARKKMIYFGVAALLGIMLVSSVVSAGLFDSIKKIFGGKEEPELAPFQAEVSIANSAPIITLWTAPDFDTTLGGINAWPPTSCGVTTVVGQGGPADGNRLGVVVTITDSNTDSDLDGTAIVDIVVQNTPVAPTITHAGSCALIASSINGDNTADFRCTFDMDFYNPQASNWVVMITATDDAGAVATNDNKQSDGTGSYPYFTYGSLADVDVDDSNDPTPPLRTLSWTGIVVTSTDVLAGTNLLIQNCGNVAIDGTTPFAGTDSYITVRGRDLANIALSDKMEPDTFSVDETTTPCNIGQRLDDSPSIADDTGVLPISVLGVIIPTGASTTDNAYFCLEAINQVPTRGNSPITPDSYSSTNAGTSWEVNACETACASPTFNDAS